MNQPNKFKLFFASILFLFCTSNIFSQNFDTEFNLDDTTQTHLILLKNGEKFKGRITSIKNEKVFFSPKKNKPDTLFTLSQIKNINVKGDLDWNQRTYDTSLDYVDHLFFINTAFNLKKGDRLYRTFMGASALAYRGLENGFSVGLGFSFPFFLNASIKISGKTSRSTSAAFKSTLLSMPLLAIDGESFLIFENSLIYTIGTPNRFFNIAITNYYNRQDDFNFDYFPVIYNSISIGGGIRINQNWQFLLENHVNFNDVFVDAKVLPSFGLSYSTTRLNFSFGFNSANERGFNLFPIMDFNDDDFATFEKSIISRLPYFTFAKLF